MYPGGRSSGLPSPNASVTKAMIATFGKPFYAAAMFKVVNDLLTFVGPYMLNAVIVYLQVWQAAPEWGIVECGSGCGCCGGFALNYRRM